MKHFVLAATLAASIISPASFVKPAQAAALQEIDMECWEYVVAITCSQKTGECWISQEEWVYICD
jgi:hypothetical protein